MDVLEYVCGAANLVIAAFIVASPTAGGYGVYALLMMVSCVIGLVLLIVYVMHTIELGGANAKICTLSRSVVHMACCLVLVLSWYFIGLGASNQECLRWRSDAAVQRHGNTTVSSFALTDCVVPGALSVLDATEVISTKIEGLQVTVVYKNASLASVMFDDVTCGVLPHVTCVHDLYPQHNIDPRQPTGQLVVFALFMVICATGAWIARKCRKEVMANLRRVSVASITRQD